MGMQDVADIKQDVAGIKKNVTDINDTHRLGLISEHGSEDLQCVVIILLVHQPLTRYFVPAVVIYLEQHY